MANKQYNLASNSVQEIIINILLSLLNNFPDLPSSVKNKGIQFYDMFPDNECIGFATLSNTKIYKRYIGGSYIGLYKFRLQYRYSTKNYKERIAKQSILSTIANWLEGELIIRPDGSTYQLNEYPNITENSELLSIENIDTTVLVDKNKTGYEDSISDFILKFHVRKV